MNNRQYKRNVKVVEEAGGEVRAEQKTAQRMRKCGRQTRMDYKDI